MLSFACRTIFRISINKNVFVIDASPAHALIGEFPQKGLEGYVSKKIQIPYLSECNESQEELSKTRKYQGSIVGEIHNRAFFSIPTALYDIPVSLQSKARRYYYVHYLFDTGSPISTLTYEAYSHLLGQPYFPSKDYTSGFDCVIGNKIVQFAPSSPDLNKKQRQVYHNVNILGMNFLRMFRRYKHNGDFQKKEVTLQLIE